MYYSDTFKSDKKTTLAINEFRKRGPAEIRTVEQICYSCQVNLPISCNRYKGDSLSQQQDKILRLFKDIVKFTESFGHKVVM